MGYGTSKATFVSFDERDPYFEATEEGYEETNTFDLTPSPEARLKMHRVLTTLEPGDPIEFDTEYESFKVFEVRAIELDPRHLLARIKRIEQHLGLEPEGTT